MLEGCGCIAADDAVFDVLEVGDSAGAAALELALLDFLEILFKPFRDELELIALSGEVDGCWLCEGGEFIYGAIYECDVDAVVDGLLHLLIFNLPYPTTAAIIQYHPPHQHHHISNHRTHSSQQLSEVCGVM